MSALLAAFDEASVAAGPSLIVLLHDGKTESQFSLTRAVFCAPDTAFRTCCCAPVALGLQVQPSYSDGLLHTSKQIALLP
jgi:hypothetical protein